MAMTEKQIQLVLAAQKGDVKSFEELYAIYYEKVYAFARMILKNENEAEDVLQETFIAAWKKLDTLQTPETFSVWIQIIAKNLCYMQLRRKNISLLLDTDQDRIENFEIDDDKDFLPAVYAERDDLKERLGKIIEGLSDVQRQTIVLFYFNELSVDEISNIMECSPGTVKSRLFLARNAIRAEVEEQEQKTGQKFYGVIGIPMLPFDKFVQSHMESFSIGQNAAKNSFDAITNSINSSSPESSPGIDTGSQATMTTAEPPATEITNVAKVITVKTKVVIGIAVVAIAVVIVALVLTMGNSGADLPEDIPPQPIDVDEPATPEDELTDDSAGDNSDVEDEIIVIPQSEQQKFFDDYLSAWTLYNPFMVSYTEKTFPADYPPYLLYSSSIFQEMRFADFSGDYLDTGDIPGDYVEQTIMRHFPVTAEQYRASLPMSADAYEYYDSAQKIYHFPGGYGGPEMTGKVTEVLQQGNYYYISCEWSDDSGAYLFSNTVTVELGTTDVEFYYKENIVTG